MEFLQKLDRDIIQINRNSNPIKMELFKSFLIVNIEKSKNNLGVGNGWTEHKGNDDLIIKGGIVNNIEYLDSIQYKRKLSNIYNNYVNPFSIFDILNEDGKRFFFKYYENEINKQLLKITNNIQSSESKTKSLKEEQEKIINEIKHFSID